MRLRASMTTFSSGGFRSLVAAVALTPSRLAISVTVRGRRIKLKQVGIFADGVAVRQAGKENFRIAREHVDGVITVTTDEICAATKDIFDDCRSVVEPAGG